MQPKTSIIIRAFNEEKHIGGCLEGVFSQRLNAPFEVILVDSGSTDRTVEIASRYDVKVVHIRPEDFSFGYSLNQGIAQAQGEFCVMLSAHCYPRSEQWLAKLLAPFDDKEVALVYGCQRGAETTKYSEHQIFATWFPDHDIPRQRVPFCNNANSAIRRNLWLEKKFDEHITGLEDVEWAKAALANGYFVSYAAQAGVTHVHDETPKQIYVRYFREARTVKTIFPDAKFSVLDFTRLFFSNLFSDYLHAFSEHQLAANLISIPVFRFLQFAATYRGHHKKGIVDASLKYRLYYPRGIEIAQIKQTRSRITAAKKGNPLVAQVYEN